jgi:hypothetical protein
MWQVVLTAFFVSLPVGLLGLWVVRKMLKSHSPWPIINAGGACILVNIFWAISALGTLDMLNSWIPGIEQWLNINQHLVNLALGPLVTLFGAVHFYHPPHAPKQLNEPSLIKSLGDFGIGLGFSILPGNFLFTLALYVLLGVDIRMLTTSWQVSIPQATWLAGAAAGFGVILSWMLIIGLVSLLAGKSETRMQRLIHIFAGLTILAGVGMTGYGLLGLSG